MLMCLSEEAGSGGTKRWQVSPVEWKNALHGFRQHRIDSLIVARAIALDPFLGIGGDVKYRPVLIGPWNIHAEIGEIVHAIMGRKRLEEMVGVRHRPDLLACLDHGIKCFVHHPASSREI